MFAHPAIVDKDVQHGKTYLSTPDERLHWTSVSNNCGDDPCMTNSSTKALRVFASNLKRLMEAPGQPLNSPQKISAALLPTKKISYKTIARLRDGAGHEPTLETVELIAKAFGLEAWQMLLPGLQPGEKPAVHRSVVVETIEA